MHTILIGDAREQLATIPDGTVQTCVTSPPYYGLRDYNVDGQIGLEDTVDAYVAALVEVFREVRRVLKDDGTLWLNLGDSYNSGPSEGSRPGSGRADGIVDDRAQRNRNGTHAPGLKPKDLIGIPWRVAFALQSDGWYLRSEIIWHKPNPMPESVTDRPTKAHETVFLLSKSPRYYYDAAAIAEGGKDWSRGGPGTGIANTAERYGAGNGGNDGLAKIAARYKNGTAPPARNKRSVWTVSTKPYSGAHFAVFPPKLIEPCILAGSSEKGQCRACGAPWVRVVERGAIEDPGRSEDAKRYGAEGVLDHGQGKRRLGAQYQKMLDANPPQTVGWAPSCACDAGDPIPQTVLDPFAGSGTTGEVAELHGRHAVLIELNPDYRPLIDQRLAQRTIWQALTEVS